MEDAGELRWAPGSGGRRWRLANVQRGRQGLTRTGPAGAGCRPALGPACRQAGGGGSVQRSVGRGERAAAPHTAFSLQRECLGGCAGHRQRSSQCLRPGAPDQLSPRPQPPRRRRHVGTPVCHLRRNRLGYRPLQLRLQRQTRRGASSRGAVRRACGSGAPRAARRGRRPAGAARHSTHLHAQVLHQRLGKLVQVCLAAGGRPQHPLLLRALARAPQRQLHRHQLAGRRRRLCRRRLRHGAASYPHRCAAACRGDGGAAVSAAAVAEPAQRTVPAGGSGGGRRRQQRCGLRAVGQISPSVPERARPLAWGRAVRRPKGARGSGT